MATSVTSERRVWRLAPAPWGAGDLVALGVWTAAIVVFFWTVVTFRGALFYFDITEINYSYRDFLAREMRMGRLSRWFPGLYCGMPLFSESQAGYLHPLKFLLYPWMPTWKAFNLDTVGSVWLTGLATYGWLRRHVSPKGALTGAAVFGLSGFVWAHLIHTSMNNALTSVPLAVWALEWGWSSGRRAALVLGGLALACQVFAGHLQDTLLTASLLGLYGLFRAVTERTWPQRRAALGAALAVIGLGVALSAVQWIPSKELLDRSPRAGGLTHDDLTYGSWHPELLPSLVVREAYGTRAHDTDWMDGFYPYHEMNAYLGLTAIALAVVGGAATRDRWVAFWILLAGLGVLLMLGKFTFLMDYAHRVPVFGSSRIPVRFHLWVSLAVAALAAVGVERLEQGGNVSVRSAFGVVGALLLIAIPIMVCLYYPALTNPGRWHIMNHQMRFSWLRQEMAWAVLRTTVVTAVGLTALKLAAAARTPRLRSYACAVLPVAVIVDLLGAHRDDVPTVPPAYWTVPPRSAQVVKADPGFIRVFGIAEKSAGEPGFASQPFDFLPVRDTLDWSLPPIWGLPSSNGQTPIIPRRMVEYTDTVKLGGGRFEIESVSHVVTGKNVTLAGEPRGLGTVVGTAAVRRVVGVQPRARIMGRPYYVKDEKAAREALDRLGAETPRRVVVEDPDRPLPETAEAMGTATITRDDPEHVEVTTASETPAYLILADTFDPGWSATVDGRPAPIRPAWLTFRAVSLSPGRHQVVFRYQPAGFAAGLFLSLLGVLASMALLAWRRPMAMPAPEHALLGWTASWPIWEAVVILAVLVGSTIGVGSHGSVGIQERWKGSWHPFTWGAKIEAIREARPR